MRILHIITQKPNSTGSGVYMSGMINGLRNICESQAVIAGLDNGDNVNCFSKDISFYPVIYNTKELSFNVLGMSDSMPYSSTKYRELDNSMINELKIAFKERIEIAIKEFKPDIVICHHLYLLTAYMRELLKDIKVIGICHGTCLRQLKTIELERGYIKSNIKNLDLIFALHNDQKKDIIREFDIEEEKVVVIGSGYNDTIFTNKNYTKGNVINITFAGKICYSKGLESLIKALSMQPYDNDSIVLNLAGTGSDIEALERIKELAKDCPFRINFLGKLSQDDLAELFNLSHIFILPSFYEGLPVVILEALACGTDVITTDINGVKEWIGEKINNSGKIDYIKLPNMEKVGQPVREELPKFELSLSEILKNKIDKVVSCTCYAENIDMSDKTWDGLSKRVFSYLDELV